MAETDIIDDIPGNDWSPYDEEVVERDYTKEMIGNSVGDISASELDAPIPEPTYDRPSFDGGSQDKSESSAVSSSPDNSNSTSLESSPEVSSNQQEQPTANPELDDLSPGQKRAAAKKSADALIQTWCKAMPYPFIKLGSFNIKKLERLEMSGEIRMDMPIQEDGTTIKEYAEETNQQIQDTLQITPEMQDELRDPLIDVLLENNLALTATQRLAFVAVSQVVAIGSAGIQLAMSKRQAIDNFTEWRKEEVSKGVVASAHNPPPPPTQQQQQEYNPEPDVYEKPTIQEDVEIIPDDEGYESPDSFGIDDYLTGNIKEQQEFDNSGVVIEGQPN